MQRKCENSLWLFVFLFPIVSCTLQPPGNSRAEAAALVVEMAQKTLREGKFLNRGAMISRAGG